MTVVRCLLIDCWIFFFLATSKVPSGWAPTCDSGHSWQLYSVAPLGNQGAGTMTWYYTQSHLDTELTSHCYILLMLSARWGSDKYQFYTSLVWLDLELNSWFPTRGANALPIRPPYPVGRRLFKDNVQRSCGITWWHCNLAGQHYKTCIRLCKADMAYPQWP